MDMRLAGLATAVTLIAIADILIPTPEDLAPVVGWVDEVVLSGLAVKLWSETLQGKTLEEVMGW